MGGDGPAGDRQGDLAGVSEASVSLNQIAGGQIEVVVQDAEAYQELLDRLERAEAVAGLREGLDSMEEGEGRPLDDVIEEIRAGGGE